MSCIVLTTIGSGTTIGWVLTIIIASLTYSITCHIIISVSILLVTCVDGNCPLQQKSIEVEVYRTTQCMISEV